MDSKTVQPFLNKYSNKEVVNKALRILAAIDKCDCPHCNFLLKKGLTDELTVVKEKKGFGMTDSVDINKVLSYKIILNEVTGIIDYQ
jgi:hypothetical protein